MKDLKDKNIRLLAEMQNVRTIAKRDVQKFILYEVVIHSERQYAIQSFGKSLLCVCDYLNLAITSVPKDKLEGESADKVFYYFLCNVDSCFFASRSCDDSEGIG